MSTGKGRSHPFYPHSHTHIYVHPVTPYLPCSFEAVAPWPLCVPECLCVYTCWEKTGTRWAGSTEPRLCDQIWNGRESHSSSCSPALRDSHSDRGRSWGIFNRGRPVALFAQTIRAVQKKTLDRGCVCLCVFPASRLGARMRIRELSLRQDPDLRKELALLARGCDFVLPSRFKKRLRAFQQGQAGFVSEYSLGYRIFCFLYSVCDILLSQFDLESVSTTYSALINFKVCPFIFKGKIVDVCSVYPYLFYFFVSSFSECTQLSHCPLSHHIIESVQMSRGLAVVRVWSGRGESVGQQEMFMSFYSQGWHHHKLQMSRSIISQEKLSPLTQTVYKESSVASEMQPFKVDLIYPQPTLFF